MAAAAAAPTAVPLSSGVAIDALDAGRIDRLVLLGRVWGFLKYHHLALADASIDWDARLLAVIPRVLAATDDAEVRRVLLEWTDALGPVSPGEPRGHAEAEWALAPPLAWLADRTLLGEALATRLTAIHAARRTGPSHHVNFGRAPTADFAGEAAYANAAIPDAGWQLLALYRWWNAVEYWFPYRDHVEGRWTAVLREFVPRFALAATRQAYGLEAIALAAHVDDGHANAWGAVVLRPPTGSCSVPARLRWVEGMPTVVATHEPPENRALRPGDAIVAIDGRDVDNAVERWTPYYPASTAAARYRDLARVLLRGPCGTAQLRVARDGGTVELDVARVVVDAAIGRRLARNDRDGDTCQRLNDEVAYLKVSAIRTEDVRACLERSGDARALIVDLRAYPAAVVTFELGGRLVDVPTPFAIFTVPDPGNPGGFRWGQTAHLAPIAPRWPGRVLVLVDETTQSQAEHTAMALRAVPGAIVVGSTTAGANGNMTRLVLPGGLATAFTGLGVFWPDRRPTQRIGIVPDHYVAPTRDGVRAGRDEVLETALRLASAPPDAVGAAVVAAP